MRFDINEALTRDEALHELISRWDMTGKTETIALSDALGRICAHDVCANYDLPRCRVAALDGIAVRSEDFASGAPDTSQWTLGNEYVLADTGDDFPDGYDTVISAENIERNADGSVVINDAYDFVAGACVRKAATLMAEGDVICKQYEKITPERISLLASAGYVMVDVIAKPVVGFIPTGTELIEAGNIPVRGENVDSNSYLFGAYAQLWGANFLRHDIVLDDKQKLSDALDWAIDAADIIIINGGSSRGSEDFNSYLLQEKSTFFKHGVKTVPGRPVGFAVINGKPVVNIPGPVNAASIAADWLLKGLIHAFLHQDTPQRVSVEAKLDHNVWTKPGCEKVEKVVLSYDKEGTLIASPAPNKLVDSMRMVNGVAYLDYPVEYVAGDMLEVELLGSERAPIA